MLRSRGGDAHDIAFVGDRRRAVASAHIEDPPVGAAHDGLAGAFLVESVTDRDPIAGSDEIEHSVFLALFARGGRAGGFLPPG